MKSITKIFFITILINSLHSCYDKIDEFEIISDKEYNIDKNRDSSIFIYTKNYNVISNIIIDSEFINVWGLQKDTCILSKTGKTELNIKYFEKSPMMDNAEVKSIKSSFFSIEKIESSEPVYKVEIYNNTFIDIRRIELLLSSRIDEHSVIFNLE